MNQWATRVPEYTDKHVVYYNDGGYETIYDGNDLVDASEAFASAETRVNTSTLGNENFGREVVWMREGMCYRESRKPSNEQIEKWRKNFVKVTEGCLPQSNDRG